MAREIELRCCGTDENGGECGETIYVEVDVDCEGVHGTQGVTVIPQYCGTCGTYTPEARDLMMHRAEHACTRLNEGADLTPRQYMAACRRARRNG